MPVVVSGLRLANDFSDLAGVPNYNIGGAANLGSGILSLMRLDNALEGGDTMAAVTAVAQPANPKDNTPSV